MKLRYLGCGGRDKYFGQNSAFVTAQNNGTNMLLIDDGKKPMQILRELKILKRENIDRLTLHITHNHGDHFHPKSTILLMTLCDRAKIDFALLKTGIQSHDNQIFRAFSNYTRIIKPKIPFVTPDELRDMLNLKSIDFEMVEHYRRGKLFDPQKDYMHSAALKFTNKWNKSTVYATDHCDTDFVKRTLADKNVTSFHTDSNDKPMDISDSHMSIEQLDLLVPSSEKPRVTCMHIARGAHKLATKHDLKTATPLLLVNEKKYSSLVRDKKHNPIANELWCHAYGAIQHELDKD